MARRTYHKHKYHKKPSEPKAPAVEDVSEEDQEIADNLAQLKRNLAAGQKKYDKEQERLKNYLPSSHYTRGY